MEPPTTSTRPSRNLVAVNVPGILATDIDPVGVNTMWLGGMTMAALGCDVDTVWLGGTTMDGLGSMSRLATSRAPPTSIAVRTAASSPKMTR